MDSNAWLPAIPVLHHQMKLQLLLQQAGGRIGIFWRVTLSSPGLLFTIDKGSKTNVVFSHTFTSEKFRKIRSSLSQQEMTSGLVQALKLQLRLLPLLGYLLVLMEKSCCCCCC